MKLLLTDISRGCFIFDQGSAAGEVQRAEFAVPSDMRKSHVALAGLNHRFPCPILNNLA